MASLELNDPRPSCVGLMCLSFIAIYKLKNQYFLSARQKSISQGITASIQGILPKPDQKSITKDQNRTFLIYRREISFAHIINMRLKLALLAFAATIIASAGAGPASEQFPTNHRGEGTAARKADLISKHANAQGMIPDHSHTPCPKPLILLSGLFSDLATTIQ